MLLQTQGPYLESQASKAKLHPWYPGPLLNSKSKRHLEPGDCDHRCLCLESSSWFSHLCSNGSHHHTVSGLPGHSVVGIIALTLSSLLRRLFSQWGSQILEDRTCFVHFALALTKHLAYVDPKERPLNRCTDESRIPLPSLSAHRLRGTVSTHHCKETGNGECPNLFTETQCLWKSFKNITDIIWYLKRWQMVESNYNNNNEPLHL